MPDYNKYGRTPEGRALARFMDGKSIQGNQIIDSRGYPVHAPQWMYEALGLEGHRKVRYKDGKSPEERHKARMEAIAGRTVEGMIKQFRGKPNKHGVRGLSFLDSTGYWCGTIYRYGEKKVFCNKDRTIVENWLASERLLQFQQIALGVRV